MKPPHLRCAIYTRKSSEEGLDQAFNSLHAQREACEAYVLSQAGEGWAALPTLYDDGGISGGTMERPALKRLLSDVDRGLIDVIVVYKVDRLTRSLADFAKIVERLDAKSVSFVSVTQAFNTTNSMGRLTLNVLLSFAQFEREVTGERIRDKITASKKKGMWMGGALPLGYDYPVDATTRALVVNPQEAFEVRRLFERYSALKSVHELVRELNDAGALTAVKTFRNGKTRGGAAWSRGALFHLLRNRIYVGEIVHRDETYAGAHPAIIDRELFDHVQRLLDENTAHRQARPLRPDGAPLTGKICDADGVAMTPAIAYGKLGRKYRYYVSQPLQVGRGKALVGDAVRRVASGAIEGLVMTTLGRCGLIEPQQGWQGVRERVERVKLGSDRVVLTLFDGEAFSDAALAEIRTRLIDSQSLVRLAGKKPRLQLTIPGRPVFRGGRTWLASPDGRALSQGAAPNPNLVKGLRKAHLLVKAHGIAPGSTGASMHEEARGINDPYRRQLCRLAYLAPDIQEAVITGQQPAGMTLEDLFQVATPLDWSVQRQAFAMPLP